MSTMPELNYKLENNKVLVSLTLKVPIQFEIEMQTMANRDYFSVDDSAKIEKVNIENAVNAGANFIINEINNFKINEQLEFLSSQIATQISTDNSNQFESDIYDVKSPFNNFEHEEKLTALPIDNREEQRNNQQIEYYNQENLTNKKRKLRFSESLNDSLSLMVNCVGGMLFIGKIANYSWE
ncbi:hypothetical protein NIES4071_83890 [Calothrix sp. NIES-4071]|nr:hypothetical protein NIES4071_83890 [Calothrix sp. NIES-4071]BAZ62657.1 hypothetical protein NIES4105_83820 [Calothrix sp. NIES-4105]